MTDACWELTAVRLGADRAARITFHTDRDVADVAAYQAQADGFATWLQPIPLPTDPKAFADLLADYVGKLGVGGLWR